MSYMYLILEISKNGIRGPRIRAAERTRPFRGVKPVSKRRIRGERTCRILRWTRTAAAVLHEIAITAVRGAGTSGWFGVVSPAAERAGNA